ncbi:MAG: pilin [Microgenomates group bacterium]
MANTLVVISDIRQYLEASPTIKSWINLDIQLVVSNLINLALTIALIAFILLLLIGGIRWITSGGDKEAVAKAKSTITAALIGLIITFSAWAILRFVRGFFSPWPTTPPPSQSPPSGGKVSLPSLDQCRSQICQEYSCPAGYNQGDCYKSCRCICDHRGGKWAYENPWCDADSHQYVCLGGSKTPDPKGRVSGRNLSCPGD